MNCEKLQYKNLFILTSEILDSYIRIFSVLGQLLKFANDNHSVDK